MCKIEELLEREQSEEKCPRVLYRGDWLQRSGCRCSGLVSKYAQGFCFRAGVPDVTEGKLFKLIKPLLGKYLPGLPWKDSILKWDVLVLAQHYGLNTRFLDWSSNPRVALYFATHKFENGECVPKKENDDDSVIWVCDLNKATRHGQQKNRSGQKDFSEWYADPNLEHTPFWKVGKKMQTLFYKPKTDLGNRVSNQWSVMCRQVFRAGDQVRAKCLMILLEQNRDFKSAVKRIVISAFDYEKIDQELKDFKIDERTIFPDKNEKTLALERELKKLSD